MKLLLAIVTTLALGIPALPALAGSCDRSTQTAKDGSRCGDRAADKRAGGR